MGKKKDESFEALAALLATRAPEIRENELPESPHIAADDERFLAAFTSVVQWTIYRFRWLGPFGRLSSPITLLGMLLGGGVWITLTVLRFFDIGLGAFLGLTLLVSMVLCLLFAGLHARFSLLDYDPLTRVQRHLHNASNISPLNEEYLVVRALELEQALAGTLGFARHVFTRVIDKSLIGHIVDLYRR